MGVRDTIWRHSFNSEGAVFAVSYIDKVLVGNDHCGVLSPRMTAKRAW